MKNTIVEDYNQQKNETHYKVSPYGSTILPGKWEKTRFNTKPKQQFFKNKSSVAISVSIDRIDNHKFNKAQTLTDYSFIRAAYERDSTYFSDSLELKTKIIEHDSINEFVIYEVYGQNDKGYWDVYYLISEKNGIAYAFSVTSTRKWSKNKKFRFLKSLFLARD